jgi:SAM-dependent methyltransferase
MQKERPAADYDEIGVGYARTRRPDPRIARRILDALGDARSVVNVGAGAGSYEPDDRRVVAVEPARTMIRQRPAGAAPVVQGRAERLPLGDGAVDGALAVLTVHHWGDPARGLAELRRVAAARAVVLTWDQPTWESFWLLREYFPLSDAARRQAVAIEAIVAALGGGRVLPVPVPHDCIDGFHGAFWRRPEAYLDPHVRAGISGFAAVGPRTLETGLARLGEDLASGAWAERHRDLAGLEALDLGYRLVVAEWGAGSC